MWAEKFILRRYCHLKNSELEPQFQKYKGRVELRGEDRMQYLQSRDHQHHK